MQRKIGFIGCGNIGSAMIYTLLRSSFAAAADIFASDLNMDNLKRLKDRTGINICAGNKELVEHSEVVILAVKPQNVKNVAEEIKECFGGRIMITIAAGVPIKVLEDILGHKRIFRAMPNLPLLVEEGMTLISHMADSDPADLAYCKAFFENFGKVEEMDESFLGTVISLTSSSPAYVFMFIESMIVFLVKTGVPVGLAGRIAAQTVMGSAKVFLEKQGSPDMLFDELFAETGLDLSEGQLLHGEKIRGAIIEAMNECNKKALTFEKM